MSGILTKFRRIPSKYPLLRGMISYALIWPTCSIVHEYLEHDISPEKANYSRAARFGIFGAFFMAPVFYGWMKFSGRFFKGRTLKTAVLRAAVEQVSYAPLAMAYFFFGMSMLEMKPVESCVKEVREKFWPTYKMGVLFWPTVQTLNFYFISEKNRIVFVSAASFAWTVYLAHMKAKTHDSKGTGRPRVSAESIISETSLVSIVPEAALAKVKAKSLEKPELTNVIVGQSISETSLVKIVTDAVKDAKLNIISADSGTTESGTKTTNLSGIVEDLDSQGRDRPISSALNNQDSDKTESFENVVEDEIEDSPCYQNDESDDDLPCYQDGPCFQDRPCFQDVPCFQTPIEIKS